MKALFLGRRKSSGKDLSASAAMAVASTTTAGTNNNNTSSTATNNDNNEHEQTDASSDIEASDAFEVLAAPVVREVQGGNNQHQSVRVSINRTSADMTKFRATSINVREPSIGSSGGGGALSQIELSDLFTLEGISVDWLEKFIKEKPERSRDEFDGAYTTIDVIQDIQNVTKEKKISFVEYLREKEPAMVSTRADYYVSRSFKYQLRDMLDMLQELKKKNSSAPVFVWIDCFSANTHASCFVSGSDFWANYFSMKCGKAGLRCANPTFPKGEWAVDDAWALIQQLEESNSADLARACDEIGSLLALERRFVQSEPFFQYGLSLSEQIVDNENHAIFAYQLSQVSKAQKKMDFAENYLRESLQAYRNAYGHTHDHVAEALEEIGEFMCEMKKYKDAELMFKEAVDIWKRLNGAQDITVANSMFHLASMYSRQKKYQESEKVFRECHELYIKSCGDVHTLVASALGNIGVVLQLQRKFKDAEAMFRDSLSMRKQIYGEKHQVVASDLHKLSRLLVSVPDPKKNQDGFAIGMEALKMRIELLGEDHPDTLESKKDLAGYLQLVGAAS